MRCSYSTLVLASLAIVAALAALFARIVQTEPALPGRLVVSPAETIVRNSMTPSTDRVASISLRLRNVGGSPLRVTHVVPSCGCMAVEELSNRMLHSGEETTLQMRAGTPDVGEKTTYVDVFCDSVLTPVVRATIVLKGGEPKVPYVTQMRDAVNLTAAPGDAASEEFSILTVEPDGTAPWLCGAACDDEHFQVTLTEESSAIGAITGTVTRQYGVRIVFKPPASSRCYGRVRIMARDRDEHVASVQLSGEVRLFMRAVPDLIIVSACKLPVTRTIGFVVDGTIDDLVVKADPTAGSVVQVGEVKQLPEKSLIAGRVEISIARVPDGLGDYVSSLSVECRKSSYSLSVPIVVKR